MIYLAVEHTNDWDANYFSFATFERAIRYIYDERLKRWAMQDFLFEEIPEGDYTYIVD